MKKDQKELLNYIAQIIYDRKGFNILALDVRGISTLCDYMIIAEGSVDRHVRSLANALVEDLKKEKDLIPYKVEGKMGGDWVVIDYNDIIVHLFMPDLREKYSLEKLFSDAKIIDLKIETEKTKKMGKIS